MRIPNCKCLVCAKPLYRKPNEWKKARHFACLEHRAIAQKISGITEAQQIGLAAGREKGTNHREGYRHKESSKQKVSASNTLFWSKNPDKALERGKKTRGSKHYRWNGGSSRLNVSIRNMNENRKWMEAVKERDKQCVCCGSVEMLEAHHVTPLAEILVANSIKNREDARLKGYVLWDLGNGETLCRDCHYKEHGRKLSDN